MLAVNCSSWFDRESSVGHSAPGGSGRHSAPVGSGCDSAPGGSGGHAVRVIRSYDRINRIIDLKGTPRSFIFREPGTKCEATYCHR